MSFPEIDLDNSLVPRVKELVAAKFPKQVGVLSELVKVPGIAWASFDPANLEKSAEMVASELGKLEFFDWIEIRRASKPDGTQGAPAVIARRGGVEDAPHVLLYAHHDVQPPGKVEDWDSEPFTATLKGDRLFARGVSDDKSGIVTHLTALEVLKELSKDLRLGVTVFIEGEEEAGSPSFDNFLEANRKDLEADLIVVADSGNWDTSTPALTTTLRGLVSVVVKVSTLDHAVHSGMFGGPVPDAMTAMIRLLASLHTESGDVAVAGLGSSAVADLPYTESQLRQDSGLLSDVQRIGSKGILQQNWGEPAITVIGIDNPAVDVSSNTLQPSVRAKISMRISPAESPEAGLDALKKHLRDHVPFGAKLEFGDVELGPGYQAISGWASRVSKQTMAAAWEKEPVEYGVGGSIPFISKFAELFPKAQILVTGVEEPDSRAHSPNESQHLPTLRHAMEAEALLLLHGNSLRRNMA
ncbi:MAG: hypothetical protein RIQ37_203 [Actinomycetota bacterium]